MSAGSSRISQCSIDRVISIDQVIGRIGEEGWSAMRRGPPCCRIGWRDELGRHFACRPECRIVEDGEILLDRTAGRIRWQTRGTVDAIAVAGVGLDQAGINGKALAADQSLV